MHGCDNRRCPGRLHWNSALLHDAEVAAEQTFRRRRAEAYDDVWANERDLLLEPRLAGANLTGARGLVDASFRARVARPLEVLHGVRDVDVVAVDSGGVERVIEQLAGWSDEGPSRLVLLIAGLFSDDHHARGSRPFAEHRLGAELEQIAALASLRRRPEPCQRWAGRNEISGGAGWLRCFSWLRHAARGLRKAGDARRSAGRNSPPAAHPPILRCRRVSRAARR